ncbi:hypothetical protein NLJ89_g1619 [Agrocybe chaxingu]|uniref:Protein kinase domain-containing protein n=1 Tax=Agrocybe chaxingu TaxID=84603 RepID=A0A9W8TEW0_9AGAR|nr:hypothetical protein NLJ89_g1619 [Agrocybe chaxingu]
MPPSSINGYYLARPRDLKLAVADVLAYNLHPRIAEITPPPAVAEPPLTFYDRHLDSNLELKQVKIMPALTQCLSLVCEEFIPHLLAAKTPFMPERYTYPDRKVPYDLYDASSLLSRYYAYVGDIAIRYASKMCLHPQDATWQTCFGITEDPTSIRSMFYCPGLETLDYDIVSPERLPNRRSSALDVLDRQTLRRLKDLANEYPDIATWEFFSLVADDLIRSMKPTNRFQSQIPGILGFSCHPPRRIRVHSDGTVGFNAEVTNFEAQRRKLRSDIATKKSPTEVSGQHSEASLSSPTVVIPKNFKSQRYKPHYTDFLQRAWIRAVIKDTSFIIFHCGRSERIGFRHRATQTLYLSEVIDPVHCKNPAYGGLHVGLHVAIIRDALERQTLRAQNEPVQRNLRQKRRRAEDHELVSPNKKSRPNSRNEIPRTPAAVASLVSREIDIRELALISLDYGIYRSAAPSSFLRVGPSASQAASGTFKAPKRQSKYPPTNYFHATIYGEPIGHGAVGPVHKATIVITLQSGVDCQGEFLIKFAFSEEKQTKLRNEMAIYEHLARASNVEGVVAVHGLFEDVETGTLAMIMDDAGISLLKRELERRGHPGPVRTTRKERDAFMRALNSIHKAGVLHNDIRPHNLVARPDGRVSIIDFDQADTEYESEDLEDELSTLDDVLRGARSG